MRITKHLKLVIMACTFLGGAPFSGVLGLGFRATGHALVCAANHDPEDCPGQQRRYAVDGSFARI
jgi:hypothetical protein